jgi:hypothetical protein
MDALRDRMMKRAAEPEKHLLTKVAVGMMHLNVIGVMFYGEGAGDASDLLLDALSPRGLKLAMEGMSSATDRPKFGFSGAESVLFDEDDNPVFMLSGISVIAQQKTSGDVPPSLSRSFYKTIAAKQVQSKAAPVKSKTKWGKRFSLAGDTTTLPLSTGDSTMMARTILVSEAFESREYESIDADLLFIDETFQFPLLPYNLSTAARVPTEAEMASLHPSLIFDCFDGIAARSPGAIKLSIHQREDCVAEAFTSTEDLLPEGSGLKLKPSKSRDGEEEVAKSSSVLGDRDTSPGEPTLASESSKKKRLFGRVGKKEIGNSLIFTQSIIDAIRVPSKTTESSQHLFQVPIFPPLNERSERTARLHAKTAATPMELMKEIITKSTAKGGSVNVGCPEPIGVLICQANVVWELGRKRDVSEK